MLTMFLRRSLAALVAAALFLGHAYAGTYILVDRATATGGVPSQSNAPGVIALPVTTIGLISSSQSFIATVSGKGSVSCTVQVLGSLDGINWATYGPTFTATGTTTATNSAYGTISYTYFAAYVTAISGASAQCTVRMGA